MKKALIVAVLVLLPGTASAQWGKVYEKLRESTVEVGAHCSGFVVAEDHVATAAHCDLEAPEPLYVDTLRAIVVMKDVKRDVMLVKVTGLKKPPVVLALKDPAVGDQIASLGFGYGFKEAMFRMSYIATARANVDSNQLVLTDTGFVPGQSGGPVVNAAGEVVMIVQLASDRVGAGAGVELLRNQIKRFLP